MFLFALLFAGSANAVLLTDSASQTSTGQLFNFALAGPVSDGSSGTLTITSQGDYSIGPFPGQESWDISIEGLFSQNDVVPTDGNIITEFSFDNVLWEIDFILSGAIMSQITADNLVNISIDLDSGVNNFNPQTDSIAVALEYNVNNVPTPTTLALFGLGLIAIGLNRKRKKS